MLPCLLLLLSLVSVEASDHPGKLDTMIMDVLDKKLSDYFLYGCQCGISFGSQFVDGIDRCCHERRCCVAPLMADKCYPSKTSYNYTYSNGTLTCDDEDESSCARRSCECDRTAVFCFKDHKYSNHYKRYGRKCKGLRPAC